jgi:hypothetical protein|tara:strand:+ start:1006 stop:1281 length:276 start_codon:yes stop_codon:yes gene_type:complete
VTDERLSRIEDKLDKLSNAVITLARMEERMITLFKRMDHYDSEQTLMWERVRKLDEISKSRGQKLHFMERIWWIVLTAAVGAGFVYLRTIN